MKKNLKNLKIWVKAHYLRLEIHQLVKKLPKEEQFKTGNQIERSSSSVADNIAEGYGAYYFNEKQKSCFTARKEALETQNHLAHLQGKGLLTFKGAKKLIKGINGYIRYIENKKTLYKEPKTASKKLIFLLFFLLFFFLMSLFPNTLMPFLYPSSVRAQTLSLGIYPPLLEVMIQPGKSITQVFKLYNFGDPAIFTSKIASFSPLGELGNINLQEKDLPFFYYQGTKVFSLCPKANVCPLFNFENADLSLGDPFFLKNGETQEVVLKLKIPEETAEGDYYAILLFSSTSPPSGFNSSTRSLGKIGANILITVSKTGKPKKRAEIVEFNPVGHWKLEIGNWKLEIPVFDSFDKIPLRLKVKNTGEAFFKPIGKITLSSLFHKKDYPILPQNILKGQTRLLLASPSASFSSQQASPKEKLVSLILSGLHLGPYKARAEFTLDEQGPKVFDYTYFWALPIKLIIGLALVFFILQVLNKKLNGKPKP